MGRQIGFSGSHYRRRGGSARHCFRDRACHKLQRLMRRGVCGILSGRNRDGSRFAGDIFLALLRALFQLNVQHLGLKLPAKFVAGASELTNVFTQQARDFGHFSWTDEDQGEHEQKRYFAQAEVHGFMLAPDYEASAFLLTSARLRRLSLGKETHPSALPGIQITRWLGSNDGKQWYTAGS